MKNRSLAASLVCALMILCVAASAEAQSGRRTKEKTRQPAKAAPVSAPSETTGPATTPTPPAKSEARRISLIVAADEGQHSASLPLGSSRTVLDGFVERLKKSAAFDVRVEKQMSRKEAGDLAKSQKETYLVWLQLDTEFVSSRRNSPDLYVEYVVFTPETAKSKAQGRIYMRAGQRRVGVGGVLVGVPLPLPRTGTGMPPDYELKQAGRDAAERVIAAFDMVAAP
jgi:hypothetical protein